MSKMETLPVVVQQAIATMLDKKVHPQERFNKRQMLENIVDVCQHSIRKYDSNV